MDLPKDLMLLYSTLDEICPSKDIDVFHKTMTDKGYRVRCRRWDDSAHVEHFKNHNEEYVTLCADFVNDVIKSDSEETKSKI